MTITGILRAEHAVFHNLFDYIERIAPTLRTVAEIKSLARLTENLLAAHSQTEDELFIEPLEHCFEQVGQRETFHHGHEVIENALAALQKARDVKAARKQLLGVVLAARKHFDKEERIVFPMAERMLKARTLAELGQQWMIRREQTLKIIIPLT
jgi:hemerythrin-like domain-containing protein